MAESNRKTTYITLKITHPDINYKRKHLATLGGEGYHPKNWNWKNIVNFWVTNNHAPDAADEILNNIQIKIAPPIPAEEFD